MQKILIVEDDIDIQDILKNHLIDGDMKLLLLLTAWRGLRCLMIQSTLCC